MKFTAKNFQLVLMLGIVGIFNVGCAILLAPAERIPERRAFSAIYLKQGSIVELRRSYSEHYRLVKAELAELEKLAQTPSEYSEMIQAKIKNHEKYLLDMESYPFICPSHQTLIIEKGEKKCPACSGRGKSWSGQVCKECRGTGKVKYTNRKYRTCPNCKKLYRGSISGKDLYENN